MDITLLNTEDSLWDEMLSRCTHDVYHTPGWTRTSQISDGGVGFGIHARDGDAEVLIPLLRREIDADYWDAVSPYGYAGPISSDGTDQEFLDVAFDEIIAQMSAKGCVSWFLRLHPTLNADWRVASGVTVEHGPTVSMDLTESPDALWANLRVAHRRAIRKGRELGLVVKVDEARTHLEEFIALYYADMKRLGASNHYLFPRDYFDKLFAELPAAATLVMATHEGRIAGGVIFTLSQSSGLMQYHLSTTNPEHRWLQPAKSIIYDAALWGREAGYRRLHLGGGIGAAEDSLYLFKRGFSNDAHRFRSHRVIVNEPKYRELATAVADAPLDEAGFFPAYRK
jgi:lipid II:glycine glycyltransferase (peptidoglycan interpeptide bridge formation enzyme)